MSYEVMGYELLFFQLLTHNFQLITHKLKP